jgi:hypothetical protein
MTISLEVPKSDRSEEQFVWHNIRGNVEHHHSDSVCSPGNVFSASTYFSFITLEC